MRKTIILLVTLTFCLGAVVSEAQTPGPASASPTKLETDEQKTFYALGLLLGGDVKVFDLKPEELAIVKAGMSDAVTGVKPQVDLDTFGPKVKRPGVRRQSGSAEGRNENCVRHCDTDDNSRHRRKSNGCRCGQGPLRRQAD
jgi:FKBP-type peptidyl-prolyl cis-trans isomerase FkpA